MEELELKYYVYKTTNIVNGKIYIGVHKSNDIENDSYIGSGYILARAIQKYGYFNFVREILFIYDTSKEAFGKEKEIVNEEFISRDDVYNVALGGHGGKITLINPFFGKTHTQETRTKISTKNKGKKTSDETKQKISKTLKENYSKLTQEEIKILLKIKYGPENPNYGKPLSEEHKQMLREINTGRKHTEESKQKMRDNSSMKDKPKSEEFKQYLKLLFTGRKNPWNQITNRDPEKIRKTAETHTGMKRSEEACKNISDSLVGKYMQEENNNFKGYWHTPFGKFASLEKAAEASDNSVICIRDRCLKNDRVVVKYSVIRDKNISENAIGKTWKELGWFFEPVENKNK